MMILGLVRWMQPVHGYDVRRELLSWSADKWANVQPGSIYHALRKLTEEGLLAEVATEQVGRPSGAHHVRGDAEGRGRVRDAAARLLVGATHEPVDPFLAAFAFLPALPRAEAAAALRNRAQPAAGRRRVACVPSIGVGLGAQTQAGARGLDVRAVDRPGPRRRSAGASGSPTGSRPGVSYLPAEVARRAGLAGLEARRAGRRDDGIINVD